MIIVPHKRTNPRWQEVLVSAPVRGRLWRDTARLYLWLRGHGVQLIPAHSPGVVLTAGSQRELIYRVRPSGRAIARVWSVVTRCDDPSAPGVSNAGVEVEYPDGHIEIYRAELGSGPYQRMASRFYVEPLAAKSSDPEELTLRVEARGGDLDNVAIESVCCFELPRAALSLDDVDFGVELETLRAGQAIYDDVEAQAQGNRGLAALVGNLAATDVKRVLINQAFERAATMSATPVNLFTHPVPVTARKLLIGQTEVAVGWEIYARVTVGDTVGRIVISSDEAADTATIDINGGVSGTTFAWHEGAPLDVAVEDLSGADGRPAGVGETVNVTIHRVSGTGQVQIEGINVCEV